MTATAEASTPTVLQTVRRWRFWAVALLVLALVAVAGLIARGIGSSGGGFAPDDAAPAGGRALNAVLQQQGVHVDVVTRLDAARAASGTLLVDDADALLDRAAWRALVAGRSRLVVVDPGFTALETVLPGASAAGKPDVVAPAAGCGLALARRAGSMSLTDVDASLRDPSATVCFTDRSGAGQLVTAEVAGTRVILLASATPFTNAHVGESGNASVALNVLGATSSLTWYRPSPIDAATGTRTLAQLTPPWVTPAVVLLLLAGAAAAFWRGRRLGPLVVERLPVLVRSRETVEGRARLYARASAHLRAADALRIGALGRIAPMLGLAQSASVEDVSTAAAVLLARPEEALRSLLVEAEPRTDRDLVRLSDDLARLEAAVRAATVPGASAPTSSAPTNGAPAS